MFSPVQKKNDQFRRDCEEKWRANKKWPVFISRSHPRYRFRFAARCISDVSDAPKKKKFLNIGKHC